VITAIVLITADVDRIPEVAQEIADLDGVTEVYSVAGDADLIAMVRVRRHEDLADTIADRLNKVTGVTGTNTHIAFRTYSAHDLEAAFSLGLENSRLTARDLPAPKRIEPDLTERGLADPVRRQRSR
jgi:DNA-binding Lrp family transcriptional regulator